MRVSQKDIARITGYSQSTISMALAGHHEIAPETQEQVRRIAEQIGYRPDPLLSGLAAYRKSVRPVAYQATLAFLTAYKTQDDWKNVVFSRDFFVGATRKAEQLGYRVENFWMHEKGMSMPRLRQILLTRNITGILLAPQFVAHGRIKLDLSPFSVVSFSKIVSPRLHTIGSDHFRVVVALMRRIRSLGYRRPGFFTSVDSHEHSEHAWLSAYWSEQQRCEPKDRIPWLLVEGRPWKSYLYKEKWQRAFKRWVKRYRPDCVLAFGFGDKLPLLWLQELEYRVPEDIGLAQIVDDPRGAISGMYENWDEMGTRATDLLVSMMHQNERGVPALPMRVTVEGSWIEGTTLRSVNL